MVGCGRMRHGLAVGDKGRPAGLVDPDPGGPACPLSGCRPLPAINSLRVAFIVGMGR
jgi:hypothetical protein